MLNLPPSRDLRGQRLLCVMASCGNRAATGVRITIAGQQHDIRVCHTHAALQAAARPLPPELTPLDLPVD